MCSFRALSSNKTLLCQPSLNLFCTCSSWRSCLTRHPHHACMHASVHQHPARHASPPPPSKSCSYAHACLANSCPFCSIQRPSVRLPLAKSGTHASSLCSSAPLQQQGHHTEKMYSLAAASSSVPLAQKPSMRTAIHAYCGWLSGVVLGFSAQVRVRVRAIKSNPTQRERQPITIIGYSYTNQSCKTGPASALHP